MTNQSKNSRHEFSAAQTQPSIGVVCGTHKRLPHLNQQLTAILSQTLAPAEIHVFHDGPNSFPVNLPESVTVSGCAKNLGVWARFFYAANLRTEYVCVFDDDTIPGIRWLENALKTHQQTGGLVGAYGLRFLGSFCRCRAYGWKRPSNYPAVVDIVGHCWFFRREWLAEFVREPQPSVIKSPMTCGEDYHMSFVLQKYLCLPSHVACHPRSKREKWGSLQWHKGADELALSRQSGEVQKREAVFNYYRQQGWRLVSDARNERRICDYIDGPPSAMYDIGVGDHSEWLTLGRMYPEMEIFGCEPNPSCFQDLCSKFSGQLLNVAIGQKMGQGVMHCPPNQRMWSTLHGPIQGYTNTFAVDVITLDEFDVRCGRPDNVLLWLDIEGSELDALTSGKALLTSGRVKWINLEVREEVPSSTWCRYSEVDQFLKRHGFSKVLEYGHTRCPTAVYGDHAVARFCDVLYKWNTGS